MRIHLTKRLVDYLSRVVPWSVNRATRTEADSEATKGDLTTLWDVDPAGDGLVQRRG